MVLQILNIVEAEFLKLNPRQETDLNHKQRMLLLFVLAAIK